MARFNLDDYEPVEDRLRAFWADHPNGRILTELVDHGDDWWIFRAEAWTDRDDRLPAATGIAHEVATAKGVNSTNAVENGETSAIGRALANLNYAAKGKRPSREEMAKAKRGPAMPVSDQATRDQIQERIVGLSQHQRDRLQEDWQASGIEPLQRLTEAHVEDVIALVSTAETIDESG
jgi:hypothetical protein